MHAVISDMHGNLPALQAVLADIEQKGIGRQMVRATERIASMLGIRAINLFPLFGSESFWRKMGYRPHHRTARVMSKTVSSGLDVVRV